MNGHRKIGGNVKHEELMQKKQAEQKMAEMVAQQRLQYLSRICSATNASLDQLCGNDLDKVEVLSSVLGHIATRAGATLEELQKMTKGAFEHQAAQLEQLRKEGKAPPAPVVERPAEASVPTESSPSPAP